MPLFVLLTCPHAGVSLNGDGPCLGTRKWVEGKRSDYVWQTYKDVDKEVREVVAGMAALGVNPKDKIGICSTNRAEWPTTALANYAGNFVTIALYDTLGKRSTAGFHFAPGCLGLTFALATGVDALEYIINHAEVRVAFCSAEKLKNVKAVLEKCPNLKYVVQFDVHPMFGNVQDAVKVLSRERCCCSSIFIVIKYRSKSAKSSKLRV